MTADIFISYSSRHRDLTRTLAAAIEVHYGQGSVWWEQAGLRAGDRFSPEITKALDAAKVVVVLWTEGAVASDWIYAEAVRAAAQRKLVPVRASELDPILIPLPFNVYHTCVADDVASILAGIAKVFSGDLSPLPEALPGQGFRGFLLDPKEALPPHAITTRPSTSEGASRKRNPTSFCPSSPGASACNPTCWRRSIGTRKRPKRQLKP